MTESAASVDLSQYDVHFCTVSGEAAPNLLPIMCYRPRKVVLFVSPELHKAAGDLRASIQEEDSSIAVQLVMLDKSGDINRMMREMLDAMKKEAAGKVLVNVTGGTKLMCLAAFNAASALKLPVFYLNSNGFITFFPAGDVTGGQLIQAEESKIELSHYLSAYGFDCLSYGDPGQEVTDPERMQKLIHEILAGNEPMKRAVSKLNALALSAQKADLRSVGLAKERKDPLWKVYPKNEAAFEHLVQAYSEAGFLQEVGGELEFSSEAKRFFVAGGWLEYYAGLCLEKNNLKPIANLQVRKHAQNELDAAFFHRNKLCVIECKTCLMLEPKVVKGMFNKLESLRKLGGLTTRLVFVSFQKIPEDLIKYGEDCDIVVLQGKDLLSLAAKLKEVVDAR